MLHPTRMQCCRLLCCFTKLHGICFRHWRDINRISLKANMYECRIETTVNVLLESMEKCLPAMEGGYKLFPRNSWFDCTQQKEVVNGLAKKA